MNLAMVDSEGKVRKSKATRNPTGFAIRIVSHEWNACGFITAVIVVVVVVYYEISNCY